MKIYAYTGWFTVRKLNTEVSTLPPGGRPRNHSELPPLREEMLLFTIKQDLIRKEFLWKSGFTLTFPQLLNLVSTRHQ